MLYYFRRNIRFGIQNLRSNLQHLSLQMDNTSLNKMLLSLCNVPSMLQRLMNRISKLYRDQAAAYLDYIPIYSETPEQKLSTLDAVLKIMQNKELPLNPKKFYPLSKRLTT